MIKLNIQMFLMENMRDFVRKYYISILTNFCIIMDFASGRSKKNYDSLAYVGDQTRLDPPLVDPEVFGLAVRSVLELSQSQLAHPKPVFTE